MIQIKTGSPHKHTQECSLKCSLRHLWETVPLQRLIAFWLFNKQSDMSRESLNVQMSGFDLENFRL